MNQTWRRVGSTTTVSVVPSNDSNYGTRKIQCRMALMKEGLSGIVSGTEIDSAQRESDKFTKFVTRRDKTLTITVLSIELSLSYLLSYFAHNFNW